MVTESNDLYKKVNDFGTYSLAKWRRNVVAMIAESVETTINLKWYSVKTI